MPNKGRLNPQQVKADQQGAKGRLTSNPSAPPILTPRTSKVPAQDSDFLTTSQGARLPDTDDSLKAGSRGPTLLEDFHLREKIMHFDHLTGSPTQVVSQLMLAGYADSFDYFYQVLHFSVV